MSIRKIDTAISTIRSIYDENGKELYRDPDYTALENQ
jgi:hypothetical protein